MQIVSRNNLGIGGDANRTAGSDVYVAADQGDYRLIDDASSEFSSAPSAGVLDDLHGEERPASGPVTFGAVETSPSNDSNG